MGKGIVSFVVSVAVGVFFFCSQSTGQVGLSGTAYHQNFDRIGDGLPPGWSVWSEATADSLGNEAVFATNTTSWAATAGQFRNCASVTNNSGVLATNAAAALQHTFTNRVLAVRQGSSFGDPGASFALQIAPTVGFSNLQFSADFLMLDEEGRETVWTVDYGIGATPAAFNPMGHYTNSGPPGSVQRPVFLLGPDANNQSGGVTIRIAALDAATGSGSRDTFGLDNVALTFEGSPASGIPLNVNRLEGRLILSWDDPAFGLQSATRIDGPYIDVISTGPTHHEWDPLTNGLTGQGYFRLAK